MKRCYLNIKPLPHYRSDAFAGGIGRHGYQVVRGYFDPRPGDLMVSWNLYGDLERKAHNFRAAGARVIVAENGPIGLDEHGEHCFALARDFHNGQGTWYVGTEDRWSRLKVDVLPYRKLEPDGFILIPGQRGIGTRTMASPANWHVRMEQILRGKGFKTRIRPHPGKPACRHGEMLKRELKGAAACVIWASGVGVRAMVEGYPVVYNAPFYCASGACTAFAEWDFKLESIKADEAARAAALHRIGWLTWTAQEVAAGTPFEYLLGDR